MGTSTKLSVIVITTAAIIAAIAATTINAATPVFANVNCTPVTSEGFTCSGGSSYKAQGSDLHGGQGLHTSADFSSGEQVTSGGGANTRTLGGHGGQTTCGPSGCSQVGGVGAPPR
jgi:hypothetical protein